MGKYFKIKSLEFGPEAAGSEGKRPHFRSPALKTGAGQPRHGAEMNSLTTCLALVSLHPSREASGYDFFTSGNRRDQSSSVSKASETFHERGHLGTGTAEGQGAAQLCTGTCFRLGVGAESARSRVGGGGEGRGCVVGVFREGFSSRLVGRGHAAGWRRQAGVLVFWSV